MTTTSPNQAEIREQVVATWNDRIQLRFEIRGSGPALGMAHPSLTVSLVGKMVVMS